MNSSQAVCVGLLVLQLAACSAPDAWTNEGVTRAGLTKGNGGVSGVDPNFCADPLNPCVQGESDCDSDAECLGALVCGVDNGPQFGLPNAWDVCVPEHCRNGVRDAADGETFTDCGGDCGTDCAAICGDLPASPSVNACSSDCPCGAGESDCNADDECAGSLVCGVDNGDQFGFGTNFDVCVPDHCRNGVQDADETAVDCGGADCGPNCGMDCAGQPANGAPNHCRVTCVCGPRQGDCDSDAECAVGSICVDDVGASFGFTRATDVCLAATCTDGTQNGDEEGVDCGPSCVPCSGSSAFVSRHGTSGDVLPTGTAVDDAGNVVIGGRFFDDTNLGGATFTRIGSSVTTTDIFVAKYDASGTHLWSRQLGSDASDGGYDIVVAIGPSGEIAVAGNYNRTVDFGNGYLLKAAGRVDAFVALLEPDGTTRWAVGFGGIEIDTSYDVAFDSAGDVYTTGSFEVTADFGSGPVTSAGGSDIFAVKLAGADGSTLASTTFGGPEADGGYAVATQGTRVYLGGSFRQSVSFGGFTGTSNGSTDGFVIEVDRNSLSPLRARFFGGTNVERVYGIDVDPTLQLAVTGIFGSTVDFGLGEVSSAGAADVYVLSLRGTLASNWVRTFGGVNNDEGLSITVDDVSRDILATGIVQEQVDNFPGGASASLGARDAYVVRYDRSGAVVSSRRDGGPGLDIGYAVDARGSSYAYTGAFQNTATVAGTSLTSAGGRDVFVGRFAL